MTKSIDYYHTIMIIISSFIIIFDDFLTHFHNDTILSLNTYNHVSPINYYLSNDSVISENA